MKSLIVAGNWKMNTSIAEGVELASAINELSIPENIKVIIAPPFTHLDRVGEQIEQEEIMLGAQDMSPDDNGAHTGEISAAMLGELGVDHVILGHSERRAMGETDMLISKKVRQALDNGLIPIICVGESLEERESGKALDVIERQVKAILSNFNKDEIGKMIIAYEPIWAIGTGKVATSEAANMVCHHIRLVVSNLSSVEIAKNMYILYGGSVNGDNAYELFGMEDIDGGLVGGASLAADSFKAIIDEGGKYA